MALDEVRLAVVERLRLLPGIVQAPDEPTPGMPDDRMLFVYPRPGETTPFAHSGTFGKVVYQARDSMVIEWHYKIAADRIADFLIVGTPMLDSVRNAVWYEFRKDGGKFYKTIDMLYSLNTDHFGEMGWGVPPNDIFTWGFRLVLDFSHGIEVQA